MSSKLTGVILVSVFLTAAVIDPADYEVTCMGYEQARLERILATGVCDWSQPGVEQTEPIGIWLRFNAT